VMATCERLMLLQKNKVFSKTRDSTADMTLVVQQAGFYCVQQRDTRKCWNSE
jgi:hypothetical protein